MSARSEANYTNLYRQFVDHLKMPLFQNGYALTLSSLATSGIGLVYWIIAAHRYSVEVIGINSAVISAMMFLAGVSELNLMSAIIRFTPTARDATKHFVIYSYLATLVVAAGISFLFIRELDVWSPALQFLGGNHTLAVWFILSTMIWCIFVLQDSVLTGLRQARWVPLENTVFSLTKIGLMMIFAKIIPTIGLFASWSLALLVAVIPTNYFIFRKLIPIHVKAEVPEKVAINPRQVIRFVAVDYVGALFWLICTTLMPVVVTTLTSGTANAYFYLSWTIANTLYLFSSSMGQSLVVEAAKDQKKLSNYSFRVFRNVAVIVLLASVFLIISAPFILRIFGDGYSAQGTTLLRLLSLSAVPFTVNSIFVSVARVQYRMKAVVTTLGSLCISVMALSFIFLRIYGIVGVGIGWVVSQSAVAGVVYFTQLRRLWNRSENDAVRMPSPAGPPLNIAIIDWLYRLATKSGFFSTLKILQSRWSTRQSRVMIDKLLPEVVNKFPQEVFDPLQDHWTVQHLAQTVTDTTVAFLGSPGEQPCIVLKLQGSDKSAYGNEKQYAILAKLHNFESLGEWRQLVPVILAEGNVDGQRYSIESPLPGVMMRQFLYDPEARQRVVRLSAAEIGKLHRLTAHQATIDSGLLERWVDEPISTLRQLTNAGFLDHQPIEAFDRIAFELRAALIGKKVYVSWIHGDFSPSNILVNPAGNQITGIVDWDLSQPNDLPSLDLIHLFLSVRMEVQQRELGHIVSDLLFGGGWTSEEKGLLQAAQQELPGSPIDLRILLVLSWLRHIDANLRKSKRFEHHHYWISENIASVVQAL